MKWKRLGYVCNPRSLKEGTETSRRRTDELGYRLERPIHFECKLNEPMHIGMRLLHAAAADHSVSINRQQVQRIFRFLLRSRARSPTNICQRGATSQRLGGRYTSRRVSSQPERARHTLCLISQGDGIHYPVGHPLLGDGIPFLPASMTDKELVWGPEALHPVNVVLNARTGQSKARAGSASSGGSACRLTTWFSSGNLGHIAGPGPQDYLGIPPVQTVGTNLWPKMRAGPQRS